VATNLPLCLHGLIANGACWTPLARALEKDYDVIMPDARGHGNSDAPDHGYGYDELVSALDVPSLLVIGDNGSVVSSKVAAELAGFNHRLKVVQITGAGHGVPFF